MVLLGVFVVAFALTFMLQRKRGAILLDQLHRATLAAILATIVALAIAIFVGG